MNTRWTILDAIRRRQRLTVVYKGEQRSVDPYLFYATEAREEVLHGWQVAGHSERGARPHWVNLTLSSISSAEASGSYGKPQRDYNPNGEGFHKVIASTPKGDMARGADE